MSVLRTKSIEASMQDTTEGEHNLKRSLSALDLVVFGVGVVIGTGIFVLTGEAAAESAGPAVAISFVVAGVVCGLAALCYAELASAVPVAGSAYTFSFATLGELVAWIIGWDLILELLLGAAVVAVGWSGYFTDLLGNAGINLPTSLAGEDATFNVPAVAIVLLLTAVLVVGIKVSSQVNLIMVIVKLAIVGLVIVAGAFYVTGDNLTPFVPPSVPAEDTAGGQQPLIEAITGTLPSNFGVPGIFVAASVVFFAFIGFDVVATTAEETKNPQRDLPIGIFGSLTIATVLYVLVSVVVTGMADYTQLGVDAPLAEAFNLVGQPIFATIISIGAIAGLTTVMMILMLGQSRVAFAMGRDHLLPPWLSKVHPRFGTPYRITIITGLLVSLMAGFFGLDVLSELVNIGTLFAFVVVSVGVVILRRTRPDLPRSFRTPLVPLVPILSVLACLYLMLQLPVDTWIRFLIWMVLGFVLYFAYGFWHSRVGRGETATGPSDAEAGRHGAGSGTSGTRDGTAGTTTGSTGGGDGSGTGAHSA